jgi:transposase
MEVLHARCAGLDVHKDSVVACVRIASGSKVNRETATFGTTTSQLIALSEWLKQSGVTHVAMEATGVYWKPVWHILEESFTLLLGNARRMRNVPGRKSDVNDANWIADLLAHGLIEPSFVPDRPIQELRDLTRTRKQLVRVAADASNRLQKVLEDANIKLGSLLSDVMGPSGRAIIDAIITGETDPQRLAALGSTRLKATPAQLREALRGRITEHHRFMLAMHLQHYDQTQQMVERIDARIEELGHPFVDAVERLVEVPGISRTAAFTLVSEIGVDMGRFERPQRLVSFAGVCPRLEESAGKKKSTRARRAGTWLKTIAVTCGWAAARTKKSYFRAQFQRIKARRGPTKAVIAVASSLMTVVFFVLRGRRFVDVGDAYFDRLNRERTARRLRKRIEALGYSVTIQPAA